MEIITYFIDEKIEAQKSCHLFDSNLFPLPLSFFPFLFSFMTLISIWHTFYQFIICLFPLKCNYRIRDFCLFFSLQPTNVGLQRCLEHSRVQQLLDVSMKVCYRVNKLQIWDQNPEFTSQIFCIITTLLSPKLIPRTGYLLGADCFSGSVVCVFASIP